MTRGDVLRYAIAFALRRAGKIIRGLKQGLTEVERYAVADHVVKQLRDRGEWQLDDDVKQVIRPGPQITP
jgi:hypothetical protein